MKDRLQNHIDEFLEYLFSVRGYSEQTTITYEISLNKMLIHSEFYEEGTRLILNINLFRMHISKHSKRTITKHLSAIRSLVKFLENQKHMSIKLVGDSSVKVPQTLPKPIEELHIDEVLSEASLDDKLLVMMLYGLGLRISELSNMRLRQISSSWIEIVGKGSKSRQLPLLPELQVLLDKYIDIYSPKKYLFEKGGAAMNSSQLRYKMNKLFKTIGIKATPHQLRHSFATHLLNNGARISDVSELLGHSSMATTQVYTKLASSKKMKEYMKAHPLAEL